MYDRSTCKICVVVDGNLLVDTEGETKTRRITVPWALLTGCGQVLGFHNFRQKHLGKRRAMCPVALHGGLLRHHKLPCCGSRDDYGDAGDAMEDAGYLNIH